MNLNVISAAERPFRKSVEDFECEASATLAFLKRRGDCESEAYQSALALLEAVALLKAVLAANSVQDVLPKAEMTISQWQQRWGAGDWLEGEEVLDEEPFPLAA